MLLYIINKMNAYEGAISQANAISRMNMDKMNHYNQVKQGVNAFNTANETGNYIRDGIKTAQNLGTEVGLATAKKTLMGGLGKVAGVLDKYRGTKGGLEGLDNRITGRYTSIQRAKIQNAKNLRQNQRSSSKTQEEEPTEEPAEQDYLGEVDDDEDLGGGVEGGAEAGAEAGVEAGVEAGAEAGVEAGVEAGAEVGGTAIAEAGASLAAEALDATGIGAIVGIPLQIAMAGGMLVSGVELGENLWSDFKDVFQHGGERGNENAPSAPVYNTKVVAPTEES